MTTVGTRTVRARPAALPAVGLAVAFRVLGVLVLMIAAGTHDAHARLTRWDSNWYASVAAHGYGFTRVLPDGRHLSDEAFFPLYPALERIVALATGLPYEDAGLVVSAVSVVAAAWGVYAVGALLAGPRAGVVLTGLWAALPTAIVLTMAYSEALFVALAAWSLHAVLRRRWLLAAGLAVLAGLTRPVGVAVVAAVLVAVAVELAERRAGRASSVGRASWVGRPLVAAVLAPVGWLGYVAWVGYDRGEALGYFGVQDGWGNGFDGGRAFATWIGRHLTDVSHPAQVAAGLGLLAGVVLVLGLFVLSIRDRQPLPVLAYSAVMLVFVLMSSRYFGSKPRYLLPAFPLLLPIALRVARWRPRRTVSVPFVVVPLVVASAVGGALSILGSGPP